jgi:hypothetical protein
MTTAIYFAKDQNWSEESTTYWFVLNGEDYGTNQVFDNDVYGMCESDGKATLVDRDGFPLTKGDGVYVVVNRVCVVTAEMRQE